MTGSSKLPSVVEKEAFSVRGSSRESFVDSIAIEEPLEIRAGSSALRGEDRSISITMRTPGRDRDLVAGFLFTEGIVDDRSDLVELTECGPTGNVWRARLSERSWKRASDLTRHFYTSSSCGVCGKASIEALEVARIFEPGTEKFASEVIARMPETLRTSQAGFDLTGGLHAAGLIDASGELIAVAEDVGRHNALDKLIGGRLLAGALPLGELAIVVSGRLSFELVQKSARAGGGLVVAVSAPSSLAIDLARECGMTLVGFTRDGGFNVYSGEHRVKLGSN